MRLSVHQSGGDTEVEFDVARPLGLSPDRVILMTKQDLQGEYFFVHVSRDDVVRLLVAMDEKAMSTAREDSDDARDVLEQCWAKGIAGLDAAGDSLVREMEDAAERPKMHPDDWYEQQMANMRR